ncbi:UDP-N-acetylglucosamine 2-epimerase (non-hydrolyzing) [Candidatus Micrarchaeota archaeon]|nr:UDP-N-acetylglucosamine 2-epimerase (non-hydrolyzing) [Candidatus Micrarchaeota archaeon]
MKVVIVTGTRPDIIKMAPLYWEGRKRGHEMVLVHAAQHFPYHLFQGVYEDLELPFPPRHMVYSSAVKRAGIVASKFAFELDKRFGWGTSKSLEEVATRVTEARPNPAATVAHIMLGLNNLFRGTLKDADIVLVHGDTLTCMAAGLSAHLNLIPVGHVEAGLRTFSREPFPEQTDTRTADACSDLFFAATKTNEGNLLREGFSRSRIFTVGNTVVDAAEWAAKKAGARGESRAFFERLGVDFARPIVYFSSHRRENLMHRERFEAISNAAIRLAQQGHQVLWSVRPGTFVALAQYGLLEKVRMEGNIFLVSDIPRYSDIMFLLSKSLFVATDSGSMQEEACALRVPCVSLRFVTDRPESVEAGVTVLAKPSSVGNIAKAFEVVKRDNARMRRMKNPYGNGNSSGLIFDALEKFEGRLIEWEHRTR